MNDGHRATPIVIVAEEPLVRFGIRKLFEAEPDLKVIGEAANEDEAVRLAFRASRGILLLNLTNLSSGLEVLRRLSSANLSVRTLLLVAPEGARRILEAFTLGVCGVVFRGAPTCLLVTAVRTVIAGQYWAGEKAAGGIAAALRNFHQPDNAHIFSRKYGLTHRELELIATVASGCSNKDVSEKFSITERTVKHHLTNIYGKLGVSNRLELAVFAVNHHLDVRESHDTGSHASAEEKFAGVL
jgi:two-component system, NarL family, nitrate/nitrite response regulator NarL